MEIRVGDTVRYAAPVDAEEAELTFRVLEHNGNRVLIQLEYRHYSDWRIRPVSTVALSDVVRVGQPFE